MSNARLTGAFIGAVKSLLKAILKIGGIVATWLLKLGGAILSKISEQLEKVIHKHL